MGTIFDTSCVLIQGLPSKAFCGIDLLSFTTSHKFQGIKHLTPGWHFVFASGTNSFSLRHGAWFHVAIPTPDEAPQLFVLQWQADTEELVPETDEAAVLRHRANIGSLWRENLTPYRQTAKSTSEDEALVEESHAWTSLTDCISPQVLTRVTHAHGVASGQQYWILTSASSAAQDLDVIPGVTGTERHAAAETELRMLPVDLKQTWREGAVGRERTDAARDRSWALERLISTHCGDPSEILGELQFTFAMVLTLNNNSCMEQWKRLLSLLFTCRQAAIQQPSFFVKAISCLRLQLEHCEDAEGGLFDLSDMGGALLKGIMRRFRAGLEGLSGVGKSDVMDELDELEDYMRTQYGWTGSEPVLKHGTVELEDGERVEMDMNDADEEEETGEYAPVLVDLSPAELHALHGDTAIHLPVREREGLKKSDRSVAEEEQLSSEEIEDLGGGAEIEDMDERY